MDIIHILAYHRIYACVYIYSERETHTHRKGLSTDYFYKDCYSCNLILMSDQKGKFHSNQIYKREVKLSTVDQK